MAVTTQERQQELEDLQALIETPGWERLARALDQQYAPVRLMEKLEAAGERSDAEVGRDVMRYYAKCEGVREAVYWPKQRIMTLLDQLERQRLLTEEQARQVRRQR